MNRILITSLLMLVMFSAAPAQQPFALTGYVFEMPVFQSYDARVAGDFDVNKNQILNLTRVRLRSSAGLWKNSRLEAEYEIVGLYFGSSGSLDVTASDKTNRQLFDLRWNPVNKEHLTLVHFIDRLYLRQELKSISIVFGRQRISWGTGRIWNPTDLFNPINPASFYKIEKDGADAVSLKYSFASFTDLNLVFNPQEKIRNSNYGFRFRTNFAEYDMSVMGGYFDKRVIAGVDFAGNLLNAGVRGEGIISVNKDSTKDRFVKFILGVDNQFTPELYALAEYHFNGEGKTGRSEYEFERLAKGEIQNLSKNYFCMSVMYQFNPLVNFSITDITNINDGSGFVNAAGSYSVTENLYLNLGVQAVYGSYKSEYRYYPFSLYLQGEYYF